MPFADSISKIYVTIFDGMFAVRSSDADPKAVKRETKNGKTIYERHYKSFTGRLKEITFRQQEFNGKQWEEMHLLVFDGQDHAQIQMPFPSNYSNSLLRAIKNASLEKEITFAPWRKVVNDKVKTAMYLTHPGQQESIPWYYSKDTPNGLPDLDPYTIPGKQGTFYSDAKRNVFFKELVEKDINPKLRAIWSSAAPAESVIDGPPHMLDENPDLITEPIDDLPF